jgi:hypothetical protein
MARSSAIAQLIARYPATVCRRAATSALTTNTTARAAMSSRDYI